MDSIKVFNGYEKVDEAQDHEFRRKTRNRLIIVGISSVLLMVVGIGIVIGVVIARQSDEIPPPSPSNTTIPSTAVSQSLRTVCNLTRYPDSCYSSMLSAAMAANTTDPEQLLKISIKIALDWIEKVKPLPGQLTAGAADPMVKEAVDVCAELIDDSIDRLNKSLSLMNPAPGEKLLDNSKVSTIRTWLSAVLTNYETCLDGFEGTAGGFREKLAAVLRDSTEFASNSLALATKIFDLLDTLGIPIHRKLLTTSTTDAASVAG